MSDPQTQMNRVYKELDNFLIVLEDEQQQLNHNEQMLKEHRTTNNLGPLNTWPALQASEQEYEFEQVSWKQKQNIFKLRQKILDCYRRIQHFEKESFEGRSHRIIRIRDDHKKKAEEERMRAEKRRSNHEQSDTNYYSEDPVTGQKVLDRTVRNGKTVYERKTVYESKTDVQFNSYFV